MGCGGVHLYCQYWESWYWGLKLEAGVDDTMRFYNNIQNDIEEGMKREGRRVQNPSTFELVA